MSETSFGDELPESRLHTFIDAERRHALYVLEGQRLIHDLALAHGVGPAFAWFRDCVLQVLPLIGLTKRGEQVGFYIDSEEPLVRLKIEAGHSGDVRGTFFPEDLAQPPGAVKGQVRLQTLYSDGRRPYLSVIEADGLRLREIVNRVLLESYQVKAALVLSEASDQSVLLHRLPPLPGEEDTGYTVEAVRELRDRLQPGLEEVFGRGLAGGAAFREAFESLGWRELASRPVRFRCGCSLARMVQNLRLIRAREGLFEPGEPALEVTCDYCRQRYLVTREDVDGPADRPH